MTNSQRDAQFKVVWTGGPLLPPYAGGSLLGALYVRPVSKEQRQVISQDRIVYRSSKVAKKRRLALVRGNWKEA